AALPASCLLFFSSRRRHTRFSRDWSSDVCSSDLKSSRGPAPAATILRREGATALRSHAAPTSPATSPAGPCATHSRRQHQTGTRSEERRVGKEGRARWGRSHEEIEEEHERELDGT